MNKSKHNHVINFNFILLNVQLLTSKEFIFRDSIEKIDANFTEAWLCDNDTHWTDCSQFNRNGYKMLLVNQEH